MASLFITSTSNIDTVSLHAIPYGSTYYGVLTANRTDYSALINQRTLAFLFNSKPSNKVVSAKLESKCAVVRALQ